MQLDYFHKRPDLKTWTANKLISRISDLLNTYLSKILSETSAQVMLNLGESDVAILFKTNNIEAVADAMSYLRKKFPIVKSYTLLIFPYKYDDITNSDTNSCVKTDLISNLDIWLRRKDNTHYHLVSNFVIDHKYQDILGIKEVSDKLTLIFGDYDIQLITDISTLINNELTLSNSTNYRYSKTSILSEMCRVS